MGWSTNLWGLDVIGDFEQSVKLVVYVEVEMVGG